MKTSVVTPTDLYRSAADDAWDEALASANKRIAELEGALNTLCGRDVSYHDGEVRIQFSSHAEALKAIRVAREVVLS